MKSLLALSLLAFATFAMAEDFEITKSIKQSTLNLRNVDVKEVSQVFNSAEQNGSPMGSKVTFEITAEYDSGYGWIQDAVLKETNISGNSFVDTETGSLEVLGIQVARESSIRLGDAAAVGGSNGKLKIPVTVALRGWSGRMTTHQWNYQILAGRSREVVKTISVTLHKNEGWTIKIADKVEAKIEE